MKRKFTAVVATLMAAILAFGISAFALDYELPEGATEVTELFHVLDEGDGYEFTIISHNLDMIIYVNADTVVYFEDYVPVSDECEEVTRNAREVLFARTLAEVLENRNMRVIFEEGDQNIAIRIVILFEIAVPLAEGEYQGIMTLPGEIDFDIDFEESDEDITFDLNGEIVVNGEILENAPAPFLYENNDMVAMVPIRAVAEALGYDVSWNSTLRSVQLGVAIQIWIGRAEVYFGRMAPIEIAAAPVIVDGITFVPHDFFRNVLGQVVYVFEGQVVISSESDME